MVLTADLTLSIKSNNVTYGFKSHEITIYQCRDTIIKTHRSSYGLNIEFASITRYLSKLLSDYISKMFCS